MSNKINIYPSSHGLSGFFLHITIFIISISIFAINITIAATEYSITKEICRFPLAHLVKYIDWENDYNEEKIGERVLNAEIDNLILGLQATSSNRSIISQVTQDINNYNSHIKQLDADGNTNGSLLSLKNNAQAENTELLESIASLSSISKIIGYTSLSQYY